MVFFLPYCLVKEIGENNWTIFIIKLFNYETEFGFGFKVTQLGFRLQCAHFLHSFITVMMICQIAKKLFHLSVKKSFGVIRAFPAQFFVFSMREDCFL